LAATIAPKGAPTGGIRNGFPLFILGPIFMGPPVLESELAALEERIQRLLAAYQQARLERRRALQERDRLVTLNNELRKRIEGVITRIKSMEQTEHDA